MNKIRRSSLNTINQKLAELWEELEGILTDEEAAYDNLPEGIQDSLRGETMAEGIDQLENALDEIEAAKEAINAACYGGSN